MSTARPTVLLFDIDGTLVTTPGAGRRALDRVLVARFGRADLLHGVPFGGMTDRGIVRAALAAAGVPVQGPEAAAAIDAVLAAYLPLLEDEIARAAGFGLHPGVHAALAALAGRPSIAVGLGTGNVRAGARIKLARVGILEHFGFGGFGCDHEDRAELLRIGAARGAATLGVGPAGCRTIVIGDTPRDVAAAQAIGAESVGVATCGFGTAELLASGASHAFPDMTAPGFVAALLGE